MKTDYHLHPLGHRYRRLSPEVLRKHVLTDRDKSDIRAVVDFCAKNRGLSGISVTDHDLLASGTYARQYAAEQWPGLVVIPGAECSLSLPGYPPGKDWVHVLCYGIERLPPYTRNTPLPQFAQLAHALGAILVLAHPVMYPSVFEEYHYFFAGYEVNSGTTPLYHPVRDWGLRAYQNSDYHFSGALPQLPAPNFWFNRFSLDLPISKPSRIGQVLP